MGVGDAVCGSVEQEQIALFPLKRLRQLTHLILGAYYSGLAIGARAP